MTAPLGLCSPPPSVPREEGHPNRDRPASAPWGRWLATTLLVSFLLTPAHAHAGDWCVWIESESHKYDLLWEMTHPNFSPRRASRWLSREGGGPGTTDWLQEVLDMCFLETRVNEGPRWAGERNAARIQALRESAEGERIIDSCTVILDDGDPPEYAKWCMRLLAMHGIHQAGDHDTFALQSTYGPLTEWELAALGDDRGGAVLTEKLVELESSCENVETEPGQSCWARLAAGNSYRWKRAEFQESRQRVLNGLWHLAPGDSAELIQTIAENDEDEVIRELASEVLTRIDAAREEDKPEEAPPAAETPEDEQPSDVATPTPTAEEGPSPRATSGAAQPSTDGCGCGTVSTEPPGLGALALLLWLGLRRRP